MVSKIKQKIGELFDIGPQDRTKLFFLALIYFLIVGAYTVTRDLKNSIFMATVGKEYVPWAKVISLFILVPSIFLYAKLVDKIRRYQLLCLYTILFGLASLIFTYYIGHPTVGISNTNSSPYRLFGWLFFFFVEGYQPFILSVFWAFVNSVNSPETAKKTYGYMVAGSKLGGMVTAALAWYLFSLSASAVDPYLSHVEAHQIVLAASSLLLVFVPVLTLVFIKKVPGRYLHGYEAAYQVEKQKAEAGKDKTGMLAGLQMFTKYPYVFGIFSMVFFYEIIATVLSILRLGIAESGAGSISVVSQRLFEMIFKTHAAGFVMSLVGTQTLLSLLGIRVCILLVPLSIGIFLLYLVYETTPAALINAFVAYQAFHYAFNWPVRESLYLPTIKEIKFKSKSWIDAFGSKFAKTSGSFFNIIAGADLHPIHSFFFAIIVGTWFGVSFFMGRRFERAVTHNEVIGADEQKN